MVAPTLSVTVTNYNYGRFLQQNIESIRSQTFEDFELILVDNASTDESVQIMRQHAERDSRIRLIAHAANMGRFASLREACDLCRGRYRVHVDADDYVLARDAFEQQVRLLDANPSMPFAFGALTMVDASGDFIHVSHPYSEDTIVPSECALEKLLTFNVNHSGMMLRLDCYRATAGYSEVYQQLSDILLAVRLSEQGDLVGYIDRPLYAFRQHGTNLNLRPDSHIMKGEILPVIAEAFHGPLRAKIPNAAAMRRRVTQNNLVHFPTQLIFSGQPRAGWQMYWQSVRLEPYDTIFQRRTLALIARTLLGPRSYQQLVSRFQRDGGRPANA